MAKSYYKQSERPVVEGINWGKIGSDLTNKLSEEVKRREGLKVEIDQASNDYLRTVQDTPQGQNVGANQRMSAFADNASRYMLDLDKKLKSGQIRLRDYNAMRANLKQGTTDMFGISKKFNDNFNNDMLRASTVASKLEVRNNAKLQEFANPSASDIIIDPITGQLSVVKMVEVDDGKGGKMRVPSSNSNDISSIFSLQNKQNQQIDKFDTKKFGEEAAKSFDNRYLKSINEGNVGTRDSIIQNPKFAAAKENYIKAALEPTYAGQSILADGSGDYEYSENIEDKGKEGIIVLIPDPNNPNSGVLVPDLTKDQYDEAYSILDEQFMARLGFSETTSLKVDRDLKKLEVDYKRNTLEKRVKLANLSVDKIEQDIKQGKEKHDANMKAATTKEEKAQVEALYYEENLNQRNLLLAAQVKNTNKPKQWEDVKEEGKAVIRNSVDKVGNLFNIEEGSDATIDDAVSFVRSLDPTIEDIIRTKDGVTIIRLDDDGIETSKKINANTKIGFIEAVMGEVAQEYNVAQYLDELDIDNNAEYQVDKGITETNEEKIIIRDAFIDESVTDDLFVKPDTRIGKQEESSQDYFNKNFGPKSGFASLGLEPSISRDGTIKITVGKGGVEDSDGNEISLTIRPQMFTGNNIDSNKKAMKDFITKVTDLNLEDFTGSISKKPTPSSTPKKKTPISI
eukprot:SAG11_NODE_2797_length_2960_cov_1.934988_3_plen_682_part_00